MAVHMTAQEARDGFAETLNRVAYAKTRVLVERRGKPVAAIVPVEDLETLEAGATVEETSHTGRLEEEARRSAIRAGHGMFAGKGGSVEEFLTERRVETEREEMRHGR